MPIPAFYRGGIVNYNVSWGIAYEHIEKYLAGTLKVDEFRANYLDMVEDYSAEGDGIRKHAKKISKFGVIDSKTNMTSTSKSLRNRISSDSIVI